MNFDQALNQITSLTKARLGELQEDVVLVRDLRGRIRLLLNEPRPEGRDGFENALRELTREISAQIGATYAYDKKDLVLFRKELTSLNLPDGDSCFYLDSNGHHKVSLHDRLLIGSEWNATHPSDTNPSAKRFTFYSMKGGVGRSTTVAVLAWHLANKGKNVLVFDFDLESPGISSTLLGLDLPQYGIVDWFVEDALGAGDNLLPSMVRESSLATGAGKISVVPAYGSDTGNYLPKLGRVYLESGPQGHETWPSRLKRMVGSIELRESPDFVLLDSRTGLHDTSAALVLAMKADTLMFAIDTPQTWDAYRFLFRHWASHPDRQSFRDRLWMVGAQVPSTDRSEREKSLYESAWPLFQEALYDEPGEDLDPDIFFAEAPDKDANHYPRPVFWQQSLMTFDPLQEWITTDINAAYGVFLPWFDRVFLDESEAD